MWRSPLNSRVSTYAPELQAPSEARGTAGLADLPIADHDLDRADEQDWVRRGPKLVLSPQFPDNFLWDGIFRDPLWRAPTRAPGPIAFAPPRWSSIPGRSPGRRPSWPRCPCAALTWLILVNHHGSTVPAHDSPAGKAGRVGLTADPPLFEHCIGSKQNTGFLAQNSPM